MRSRMTLVAVVAVVAVTAALPARAEAALRVLATVPTLAAVAKEVGGSAVTVTAMARGNQDPHFVDAKPSLALQLNSADLLLLIGLDLEIGWLPTLIVGARNPAIQMGNKGYLDCSRFVRRLEVASQPVDRSMGDIHPVGNPHYLVDPRASAEVARGIAERLGELDPAHAAVFQANLNAFLQKLQAARRRWEARMQPLRGAPVVEYHKTLAYLVDWLGLTEIGYLEPKPGIPPNPQHVAHLLGLARAHKARAVVQEEYYPESIGRLMADKIPAAFLKIPGGANFQAGQSYIDYLDQVVVRLAQTLEARRAG